MLKRLFYIAIVIRTLSIKVKGFKSEEHQRLQFKFTIKR